MKTAIFAIIIMMFAVSCKQSTEEQRAIITGHVLNFAEVSDHDFVEIILADLLDDQKRITESINDDGFFRCELNLEYPTDFYLKYSGLLTFYISPGDSIHFDINGDCWNKISETIAEEYEYYKVSGTSEKMNRNVSKFSAFFNDSVFNWQANSERVKKMESLEYKAFKEDQLKEYYEILDSFNVAEKTGKDFRRWAKNYLKYENWYDLMQYRWAHPMGKTDNPMEYVHKMPKEYFSFLQNLKNRRSEAFHSSGYFRFLQEYAIYIDQLIPQDTQKVYLSNMEENFEEAAKVYLRHYQRAENGFMKDILISKFYYRLLDAKYYAQLKNIFDASMIHDEKLRKRIQGKFNYERDLFENPAFAAGSKINELKTENNFLQALIKKYPGKVIYIDFWAPWCGPCMDEMPHAKKIKKTFEHNDVIFVYLANRCTEIAWKTIIAERQIEGEHYLLTDKQYSGVSGIFGITGIPHYSLIDKNGNIVSEKAPRPSNRYKLIELINQHLN